MASHLVDVQFVIDDECIPVLWRPLKIPVSVPMLLETTPASHLANTEVHDGRATTAMVAANDARNASVAEVLADCGHRSVNRPFSVSLGQECHKAVPP